MPLPPPSSTSRHSDHENNTLAVGVLQPDLQLNINCLPRRAAHGVAHRVTKEDFRVLKGFEVGYKVQVLKVRGVRYVLLLS